MAHIYDPTDRHAAPTADRQTAPTAVSDLINQAKTDVQALVKDVIALAKAELIPQAKSGGIGVGLFAVAAYFALNGLSLLFLCGALALAMLFDAPTGGVALGFLIMAGVVFLIAGVLAFIGLRKVKKVKGPQRTQAEAQAAVESVKAALTRATAEVETNELERKTFRHPDPLP
jgi:hypothetical protein